jgi:hypothetical protein
VQFLFVDGDFINCQKIAAFHRRLSRQAARKRSQCYEVPLPMRGFTEWAGQISSKGPRLCVFFTPLSFTFAPQHF